MVGEHADQEVNVWVTPDRGGPPGGGALKVWSRWSISTRDVFLTASVGLEQAR